MPVFYVDSWTGRDSNPGTEAAPWMSLTKMAQYIASSSYEKGDQFKLAWGSIFDESVSIAEDGLPGIPLTISSYIPNTDREEYGPPVVRGKISVVRWVPHSSYVWKAVLPFAAYFNNVAQVYFGHIAGIPRANVASLAADLEWHFDSSSHILYVYTGSGKSPYEHYGHPTGNIYFVPGMTSGSDVLAPPLFNIAGEYVLLEGLILEGIGRYGIYVEEGKTLTPAMADLDFEGGNFPGLVVRNCLFREPLFYDKARDLSTDEPEPVYAVYSKDSYVFCHHNTYDGIPFPLYATGKGIMVPDSDLFAGADVGMEADTGSGSEVTIFPSRARYLGTLTAALGRVQAMEANLERIPAVFKRIDRIRENKKFIFILDDPFFVPSDYAPDYAIVDPETYLPELLDQFLGRGLTKGPALAVVGSRPAESPNCWSEAKEFLREWDARGFEICMHSWSHTTISSASGYLAMTLQAVGGYSHTATADVSGGHLITWLDSTKDQDYDLTDKTIDEVVTYFNGLANYKASALYQYGYYPESLKYTRALNMASVTGVDITPPTAFLAWDPDILCEDEVGRTYDFLKNTLGVNVQRLYVMPYGGLYECTDPEGKINTKGNCIASRDAGPRYFSTYYDYQRMNNFRLSTYALSPSITTPDFHEVRERVRDYVAACLLRGMPAIIFCHPMTTPAHVGAALDGALEVADHWGVADLMEWMEANLRQTGSGGYFKWHWVYDFADIPDLTPYPESRCVGEGREIVGTDLFLQVYPLGEKTDIGAIRHERGY
jgi:hypothetical protein